MLMSPIGPVVFAGENSVIWLHDPGMEMVAAASFWHADWSPAGAGSALFLWADPLAGSDAATIRLILTDSPELATFIDHRFNRFFPGCAERGFGAIAPMVARFSRVTEGQRRNRVVAVGASVTVELDWQDPAPGPLTFFDSTADPEQPYDVTSVICPCRDAWIVVDGTRLPGRVIGNDDLTRNGGAGHEPGYRSAFLAFGETWIERSGPSRLQAGPVAPPDGSP